MLLVTHDVEEALLLCERVVVLADGRVAEELDARLPRAATRAAAVSSAAFLDLRRRALEAIG